MIILIIAILIHIYTTFLTHKRVKHNGTIHRRPLYDIIHTHTPNLNKYSIYLDLLIFIFVVPFITNYNSKAIINFINIFSIIIILRSFAILMTDIPSSDKECDPNNISIYNIIFGHCSDKIFSNHTAFTLLALLVIYEFNLLNMGQLLMLGLFQILYALLIIITRAHYSVDVLLSYYIVVPLYYLIKHNKIFN